MPAGTAHINGADLYFEDEGTGPPVVLVHAGIVDSRMWDDQFALLTRDYRVLRYDLRGFGRSSAPPGPYAHRTDLVALLQARAIARAHLVGVSIGAATIAQVALEQPELVDSLALVAAGFGATRQSDAVARYRADEEAALANGELERAIDLNMATWVDGPRRQPEAVDAEFRRRAREIVAFTIALPEIDGEPRPLEPPATERLGQLTAPTLVLYGDEDVEEVLETGERLVAELPRARRVILAGAAHLPSMEQPAPFNESLLDFLHSLATPW